MNKGSTFHVKFSENIKRGESIRQLKKENKLYKGDMWQIKGIGVTCITKPKKGVGETTNYNHLDDDTHPSFSKENLLSNPPPETLSYTWLFISV